MHDLQKLNKCFQNDNAPRGFPGLNTFSFLLLVATGVGHINFLTMSYLSRGFKALVPIRAFSTARKYS